jgi:hypothetical protein
MIKSRIFILYFLSLCTIFNLDGSENRLYNQYPDEKNKAKKYYINLFVSEIKGSSGYIEARSIFRVYLKENKLICMVDEFTATVSSKEKSSLFREKTFILEGIVLNNEVKSIVIKGEVTNKDVVKDVYSSVINEYLLLTIPTGLAVKNDAKLILKGENGSFDSAVPVYNEVSVSSIGKGEKYYFINYKGNFVININGINVTSFATKNIVYSHIDNEVISLVKTFYTKSGGRSERVYSSQLHLIKESEYGHISELLEKKKQELQNIDDANK